MHLPYLLYVYHYPFLSRYLFPINHGIFKKNRIQSHISGCIRWFFCFWCVLRYILHNQCFHERPFHVFFEQPNSTGWRNHAVYIRRNCGTTCIQRPVEEKNVLYSSFFFPVASFNWVGAPRCASVTLSGYRCHEILASVRIVPHFIPQKAMRYIHNERCRTPEDCAGNSKDVFGPGVSSYWPATLDWRILSLSQVFRCWGSFFHQNTWHGTVVLYF